MSQPTPADSPAVTWQEVAEYYLGDYVYEHTPEEARAEAFRRSDEPDAVMAALRPADPELDEIVQAVFNAGRIAAGELTTDVHGKWIALRPDKAAEEIELWKQRAVVAAREDEADVISKVQTRQGAKGVRHFAKDRRQMFKDRLSQLTAQPDKGEKQ